MLKKCEFISFVLYTFGLSVFANCRHQAQYQSKEGVCNTVCLHRGEVSWCQPTTATPKCTVLKATAVALVLLLFGDPTAPNTKFRHRFLYIQQLTVVLGLTCRPV